MSTHRSRCEGRFSCRDRGLLRAAGRGRQDWWVQLVGAVQTGCVRRSRQDADCRSVPTHGGTGSRTHPSPGRRGFDALNPKDAGALWILMLFVGVLLLIVCANVANLLFSRSVGRQPRVCRAVGPGSGENTAVPPASDRERSLGAFRWRRRSGVGICAGTVDPPSVSDGPRSSSAFDLHLDPRSWPIPARFRFSRRFSWPGARGARRASRSGRRPEGADAVGDGRPSAPASRSGVVADRAVPGCVSCGRALGRTLENLKWVGVGFDRENLAYATVNPGRAGYPWSAWGLTRNGCARNWRDCQESCR